VEVRHWFKEGNWENRKKGQGRSWGDHCLGETQKRRGLSCFEGGLLSMTGRNAVSGRSGKEKSGGV